MPEQPSRKRPAWLPFAVVGGAVVVTAVLWAALSSTRDVPARVDTPRETFTLTGRVVVPMRVETFVPDGGCIGERGFSDVEPGLGVTVSDSTGSVLAIGELTAGRADSLQCVYAFTVPGVTRGMGTYQVEVTGRGKVTVDENTAITVGALLKLG